MLKSGEKLEGKGGTIAGTRLIARGSDGQELELPVSDIRWLDYSTGSKVRRGAIVGGASAAVFSLATFAGESSHGWGPQGRALATLVLVGVGAGIGALIGLNFTQWERAIGELDADSEHASVGVGVKF